MQERKDMRAVLESVRINENCHLGSRNTEILETLRGGNDMVSFIRSQRIHGWVTFIELTQRQSSWQSLSRFQE